MALKETQPVTIQDVSKRNSEKMINKFLSENMGRLVYLIGSLRVSQKQMV